ncbi:MAG: hypothetical protein E7509_05140 [Ruminococcus sp.]|nr:hypothetical protein [Ruminococcus sp.]
MSEIVSDNLTAAECSNPLMSIDTSFRSYLNAYTRSFSNHIVGGALDYALDSDFAVRQKIQSLSAWNKLSKSINTVDITQEAKMLFSKCNQAGMLKYPEVYDIVRKCADRLEMALPIVFVREDTDKKIIYSIASDIIEPCIIVTTGLIDSFTQEELQVLIGYECGKLQNNHIAYNFGCVYISNALYRFLPVTKSYTQPVGNQVICALSEWIDYADITADRAAIICCDDPKKYSSIFANILDKGFVDFYGREQSDVNLNKALSYSNESRMVMSRFLKPKNDLTKAERRIVAAEEFIRSDGLYLWRKDLEKPETGCISLQECNIRCNIISGKSTL